jgi:phosphoglycerol transferase MdoB-like AlkP superfamily enzyme
MKLNEIINRYLPFNNIVELIAIIGIAVTGSKFPEFVIEFILKFVSGYFVLVLLILIIEKFGRSK